jgi:hypothetical protein
LIGIAMSAAAAELASATVATPVKSNFFTGTPNSNPRLRSAILYQFALRRCFLFATDEKKFVMPQWDTGGRHEAERCRFPALTAPGRLGSSGSKGVAERLSSLSEVERMILADGCAAKLHPARRRW